MLKIGVMLRHSDERGGIQVYTTGVLNALLDLDHDNQYVMIYQRPDQLGRFADRENVEERVARAAGKLWWDQVSVPRLARRHGLDIVYNPKLSIPLLTRSKRVLVMHGADQFATPEAFKWSDRLYFNVANWLYCKRASGIISMTHMGARDIQHYMGADPAKIHVIYESFNESCRVLDEAAKQAARDRYGLPERFILFVGGIDPSKNLGNLLRAYAELRARHPHKLVLVGFRRRKSSQDLALIDSLGLRDDVVFTGFIPDEDIPAMYNLADVFVMPSFYEGFGMPVLEAMACGCPVVASKTGCSPEVAGGAALLADPHGPEEIGQSIEQILTQPSLRERLVESGLERARQFSWKRCAGQTLELFEQLAGAPS